MRISPRSFQSLTEDIRAADRTTATVGRAIEPAACFQQAHPLLEPKAARRAAAIAVHTEPPCVSMRTDGNTF